MSSPPPPSADPLLLDGATARVAVEPALGGRISSLQVFGHELLVGSADVDDPLRWGCYPMVPWAGRVADGRFRFGGADYSLPITLAPHAIHGVGYVSSWQQTGPASIELVMNDGWPFGGVARSTFSLADDGLRWDLAVTAEQDMPVNVGWHPWFHRVVDEVELDLDFEAAHQFERDERHIPTGQTGPVQPRPWDDCFGGVVQPVVLRWPGKVTLELRTDCSYWVVYDEPDHAVCVEPMSAPPDAFNRPRPETVAAGGTLRRRFDIRWRR